MLVVAGGIAIGLAVGWLIVRLLPRLADAEVAIGATLLAPVAAYLPAEVLRVSAVLAAVTAGLVLGRRSPAVLGALGRLEGRAVWSFVVFVINGLVFVLIGLQLPAVLEALAEREAGQLARAAVAVCLVTVLVRIAWVFPATYLPRRIVPGLAERDPRPSWRPVAILGWAGLRGVVSLAAALALLLETDAGRPFPARDLILFLTFCVILVTLVGQGPSLPWLIRRLGVADDGSVEREEMLARREATRGALDHLDRLAGEPWVPDDLAAALRRSYAHRLEHWPISLDPADRDGHHVDTHLRLRRELLQAERRAMVDRRDRGAIGDEALRRVERDLDLAEVRQGE